MRRRVVPITDRLTLGYADVAALTGVSERTVRRLVRDGTLPSVHIHGRVMVTRRALDAWLATDAHPALKAPAPTTPNPGVPERRPRRRVFTPGPGTA